MRLIRHHDVHRDLTMRRSFVTDQGNRPQRGEAHLLRLLASRELPLFFEIGPTPIRFLQLPLDVPIQIQLLVPYPAHEINAVILFEFAKQIRPPVAAIHQQNLQPFPQRPYSLIQARQHPAQQSDFAFLQPAQDEAHDQFTVVLYIEQD